MRRLLAAALPLLLAGASCVGPSVVGFPHPVPLPAGGGQFGLAVFTGGGYPHRMHAGAGLGYAGTAGDVGVSVTASGLWPGSGVAYTGHLELAVPLAEPPATGHVLVGAGYWGFNGGFHSPQLSIGYLDSAPRDQSGWFGGVRASGGVSVSGDGVDGGLASASAGGGYRWLTSETSSVSFQVEPLGGYYGVGGAQGFFAMHLMLCGHFGL